MAEWSVVAEWGVVTEWSVVAEWGVLAEWGVVAEWVVVTEWGVLAEWGVVAEWGLVVRGWWHLFSYLPNALNKETISPRVSWNGICDFLCSLVTVDSGPIESPEKRIFRAVPIPVIWKNRQNNKYERNNCQDLLLPPTLSFCIAQISYCNLKC